MNSRKLNHKAIKVIMFHNLCNLFYTRNILNSLLVMLKIWQCKHKDTKSVLLTKPNLKLESETSTQLCWKIHHSTRPHQHKVKSKHYKIERRKDTCKHFEADSSNRSRVNKRTKHSKSKKWISEWFNYVQRGAKWYPTVTFNLQSKKLVKFSI